jgi:hypothetical protein
MTIDKIIIDKIPNEMTYNKMSVTNTTLDDINEDEMTLLIRL